MFERECQASDTVQDRFQKSTTFLEVALVARIFALQELSKVRSCRLPSQPIGSPFLKMIPSLMLQNLNGGRRVPLAIELPEPQHASLYANINIVFEEPALGGTALL